MSANGHWRASMWKKLVCQTCSQRQVMIMDNCEKDIWVRGARRGGTWTHSIPWAIVIPPPPFPPHPCFIARFCYCSLAHLAVWNEQVSTVLLTPHELADTWALPRMVFLFGSKHVEVYDLLTVLFEMRSYSMSQCWRKCLWVYIQVCVYDFLKREIYWWHLH